MRDAALIALLLAACGLALARPWLGAVALSAFALARPFGYGEGAVQGLPALALLMAAVLAGMLLAGARGALQPAWHRLRDWRLVLLGLLWLQALASSWNAQVPELAWQRFAYLSGLLLALLLLMLLVDQARRLRALLAVAGLSIASVAVKGGYWALIHGFSDRVYGPPASHYYDNNHFAILVIMSLPLLALLYGQSASRGLRLAVGGVLALSVCAALSSWSRGALLAGSLTLLLMALLQTRQRLWALTGLAGLVGLSLWLLPGAWQQRMQSIAAYQQDDSALGRLEMWRLGWTQALEHPWLGVGFEGWRQAGGTLDWHSAYVQVLAGLGFPGLALWLTLLLGTLLSLLPRALARPARLATGPDPHAWAQACARALLIALAGYAVGALFLGIAYWEAWLLMVAAAAMLARAGPGQGSAVDGAAARPRPPGRP